jgi:copper chaperone CopZ
MKKVISLLFVVSIFCNITNAQSTAAVKDTTITLKVKGLTCSNDLKTIAINVKEIKGVSECKPGKLGPTSSYKITFNPALVKKDDLVNVIENTPGCGDGAEKPYKVKKN